MNGITTTEPMIMWRATLLFVLCGAGLLGLICVLGQHRELGLDDRNANEIEPRSSVEADAIVFRAPSFQQPSTRDAVEPDGGKAKAKDTALVVHVSNERREPVANALAELLSAPPRRGAQPTRLASATTDELGCAYIDGSDGIPDPYLRVECVGHATVVTRLPGAPRTREIEVTLRPQKGSGLFGRVTYRDGLPATDVTLELVLRNQETGTASECVDRSFVDVRGAYECRNAPPGNYVLALRRMADAQVVERREITLGVDETRLDLILQLSGRVRGRVHDVGNAAVRAFLVAQSRGGPEISTSIHTTYSDSISGRFEFPSLPAGDYWIDASAEGYAKKQLALRVDAEESREVDIELIQGGAIHGRLIATNLVRAQMNVFRLAADGPQKIHESTIGSDGRFAIESLVFGAYRLEVESAEYANAVVARVDLSDQQPIVDLDISLERGASVRGTVVTRAGMSLASSGSLRLRNDSLGVIVIPIEIEDSGAFLAKRLPSGNFDIELRVGAASSERTAIELLNESSAELVFGIEPSSPMEPPPDH